jgi:hypothetical protein
MNGEQAVGLQFEWVIGSDMRRPKAKQPSLAGKAPLGSLPAEKKGQSAASSKHDYTVGDGVNWATASTAGEWTFIGPPARRQGRPGVGPRVK